MLALVAVAVLLPESRSEQRPSVDFAGVALSSAGLAGLTYGFIRAGQNSWTDAAALATIAAGLVVLVVFVAWERWLTGRAAGVRPLIELGLFRSAGFTWGTVLATLVSFAMFGIFFAMPQYFQEVRGLDAMGSGLRLLPMIGGHGGRHDRQHPAGDAAARPDGRARWPARRSWSRRGSRSWPIALAVGATTTVCQRHRVRGGVARGGRPGARDWPCRRR